MRRVIVDRVPEVGERVGLASFPKVGAGTVVEGGQDWALEPRVAVRWDRSGDVTVPMVSVLVEVC